MCEYWTSVMFSKEIVGTANGTFVYQLMLNCVVKLGKILNPFFLPSFCSHCRWMG